ncbi:MAG TPA: 6-phosphogluconolactonase [Candidatus Limnocylindrales bacterium]|nr:6-phosphogluconolactonase [Candidatus Limnocylindrales bacterium]
MAASVIGRENPYAERLFVVPSAEELARAAAGRLWGIVRERAAMLSRGGKPAHGIHVALSGGETPRRTYEVLTAEPYRARFPWDRVHFHQVDERWVPPEDPLSNRRMLMETLLSRAPVPEANVSFVDTGLSGPEEGARRYEESLRAVFPDPPGGFPRFDAIVLGIGKDGHTASLFPGRPETSAGGAWAVATTGGEPPVARVTLTLPVLSAAAQVIFLVTGGEKARALRGILSGDPALPASRVSPARGKVTFLADEPAASLVTRKGRAGR